MQVLEATDIHAGYGGVPVLHGVSLYVDACEVISVVGANGAGKTTLLSVLSGLVKTQSGSIAFNGADITAMAAYRRPAQGIAMVPEGGRLFPFMSVKENLELGAFSKTVRAQMASRMEEMFEVFPLLKERRQQLAGHLSGGERQMCAIARAMMSRPQLLLLDEPSVGLSPMMTERVFETVKLLVEREKLTVVLVEQHVTEALEISDRAYVLDHGAIVTHGSAEALSQNRQIQETYMGL